MAGFTGRRPVVADAAVRAAAPHTTGALPVAAGLAVTVGVVLMLVALVAVPGPWTRGYVSEAGAAAAPLAMAYRCAVILFAAGVALLGGVFAPVSRRIAALLVVAAGLAATSGAVPCSAGCPLPPHEPTTVADVVHAGAGIVGMAAAAFAMLATATAPTLRPALRRLAASAAAATFPLAAVEALGMLLAGRGALTGTVERLLLAVAVGWLVSTAALAARPSRSTP
jgi:hypothetical protein